MKKCFFGIVFMVGLFVFPVMTTAQINIQVQIPVPPLPPPIPFVAPPHVIVLPGTDVYVVPDIGDDFFFQGGWWWRYHGGHWYRSHFYDRGWGYYRGVPPWYGKVPGDWRIRYRDHVWGGYPWRPPLIDHGRVVDHWRGRHWRTDHGWDRTRPPRGGPGGKPPGWKPPGGGPGGKPPGWKPPGGGPGGKPPGWKPPGGGPGGMDKPGGGPGGKGKPGGGPGGGPGGKGGPGDGPGRYHGMGPVTGEPGAR